MAANVLLITNRYQMCRFRFRIDKCECAHQNGHMDIWEPYFAGKNFIRRKIIAHKFYLTLFDITE